MANSYNNRYQYETSPRKLEPYRTPRKNTTRNEPSKKNNINKQKEEKKMKRKVIIYSIIILSILFAITYRNAKIDENFEKLQSLKENLATVKKENTQLEVAIESSLNLTNLENQARVQLGMQKLTNKQTEYITLPKSDYIEPAAEEVLIEQEKSVFAKVGDWFEQLFK